MWKANLPRRPTGSARHDTSSSAAHGVRMPLECMYLRTFCVQLVACVVAACTLHAAVYATAKGTACSTAKHIAVLANSTRAAQTRAEQAAFAAGEQLGVSVVAVNPNFIMGPLTNVNCARGSISVGFFRVRVVRPAGL